MYIGDVQVLTSTFVKWVISITFSLYSHLHFTDIRIPLKSGMCSFWIRLFVSLSTIEEMNNEKRSITHLQHRIHGEEERQGKAIIQTAVASRPSLFFFTKRHSALGVCDVYTAFSCGFFIETGGLNVPSFL